MSSRIYAPAFTTPKIRQELKDFGLSIAKPPRYSFRATATKWLKRDAVQNHSHRACTLHTALSAAQELVVLSPRQTLYLLLRDLLHITRQ